MQENTLMIFLVSVAIGLVSLIVGVVIGAIIGGFRNTRPAVKPEAGPRGMTEAARLWRSRKSGSVMLEMDRQYFSAPADLDDRHRQALNGLVSELELWVGMDSPPDRIQKRPAVSDAGVSNARPNVIKAAPAASAPISAEPRSIPQSPASPAAPSSHSISERLSTSPGVPAKRLEMAPEVQPPSLDMSDILSRALVPDVHKEWTFKSKSIAAQIDEVIQDKIQDTAYRGRNIHIRDGLVGEIVVWVENVRYSGIDEVQDPGVREFLHACITDWERRISGD